MRKLSKQLIEGTYVAYIFSLIKENSESTVKVYRDEFMSSKKVTRSN